jgi:putative transposase
VKRGLVVNPEDWKWSSYRHYALREAGAVKIESEWTARDREQQASGTGATRIFLFPG